MRLSKNNNSPEHSCLVQCDDKCECHHGGRPNWIAINPETRSNVDGDKEYRIGPPDWSFFTGLRFHIVRRS